MGIIGLRSLIRQRYPFAIRKIQNLKDLKANYLFIDISNPFITLSSSDKGISTWIYQLVHKVRPTDLIFISMDGGDAFAKKYGRIARRHHDHLESEEGLFLSSADFIEEDIKEKIKRFREWQIPEVILSSSRHMGEAETKIFDFIRNGIYSGKLDKNANFCIYSPDNDVILYCLRSHVENINLIVQANLNIPAPPKGKDLLYLSIPILREHITLEFQTNDERIYDDFAFIFSLFTKDYFAPFDEFNYGDLADYIECYKKCDECRFITNGDEVDYNKLAAYLKTVLNMIAEGQNMTYDQLIKMEKLYWSRRRISDEETAKISHDMMDGIMYISKLQTSGTYSFKWIYKHHFSPPLSIFMQNLSTYKFEMEKTEPIPPIYPYLTLFNISFEDWPEIEKVHKTDEYFVKLIRDWSEIDTDPYNKRHLFEIPDYEEVRKRIEPWFSTAPEYYQTYMQPGKLINMKTGERFEQNEDRPFPVKRFGPDDRSRIPSLMSFNPKVNNDRKIELRGPFRNDFSWDREKFLIGTVVYGGYPFKRLSRVVSFEYSNEHRDKILKYKTHFLNPTVCLKPIDETGREIGPKYKTRWVLCLGKMHLENKDE